MSCLSESLGIGNREADGPPSPGILLAEANLETGKVGEWTTIWNGTGGSVSARSLMMCHCSLIANAGT